MNSLTICFIIDNNLVNHILPVIQSILKYSSIPVHFCILTNEETTKTNIKNVLESLVQVNNYEIAVLCEEDKTIMKEVYSPESRTDLTYFIYSQFYISKYFCKYKKILFLEPDQIVKKDLCDLWNKVWNEDIKLAAVVSNAGEHTINTLKSIYPNKEVKTFNAGVVIVDTEYWNDNKFTELCIRECIKQKDENGNRYDFYQEGAMNIALQEYFIELDTSYNCMGLGWQESIPKEEIEKATILHWNGNKKPWLAEGLYKEYYSL